MTGAITFRAPTRIDFGGGWTDVPPYSDEAGGFVCNVAIARYATVTVTRGLQRDSPVAQPSGVDRAIVEAAARRFRMADARITVHSDFPIGAGLGGSSAVCVAALAALAAMRGETLQPSKLAEMSREIEVNDLGVAGGRQDHYAAAHGGALGLRFLAGRVEVRHLLLGARMRAELERRCFIVYTGQSRISSDTITAVLDGYKNREPHVLQALARMRATAEQMADAFVAGNIDALGSLVDEQWRHQRSLHPAIPTPEIDEIISRTRAAGALGAKALGASGGGCVLIIARSDRVEAISEIASSLGQLVPFTVDEIGVERCP